MSRPEDPGISVRQWWFKCAFEGVPWPGLVVCICMGQTEEGEGLCLKPTCRIGVNEAGVGEGFCG